MSKSSRSRPVTRPGQAPAAGQTQGGPRQSSSPSSGSRNDATGSRRQGRRERARPVERSLFQRYRSVIVGAVVVVVVAAAGIFVFASATSPAYACSAQFQPSTSPDPSHLGVQQDDLGRSHVGVGVSVTYPLCPPASGNHYNTAGDGPIQPRLYGPNEQTVPQGWIHNLEHGALVVLYRCASGDSGCSDSTQASMRSFVSSFPTSPVCGIPPGQISPVVTRFDQMPKPYAALVWGRVLYLDSFDTSAILAFFHQEGERTNPEPQCASPSPSASGSPGASAGASPGTGTSASPGTGTSASPSPAAASPSPS